VAYPLEGGKFKKQMEEANDTGAKRVLFFGSNRAPAGSYEVKDLATGTQQVLGEEAL
jgi:histidyl-tRNA synthetase